MTDRQPGQHKRGWRNRIVGTGEEAPDQLLANPGNWRIHPKAQQDALGDALDDIGWIQQVVVNRQSGHLVDGHLRVSLALRNNEPTVPVLYVDLDEREEALALATLDPIGAMAAADKAKLDELLREVDTGSAALQEMLAGLAGDAYLPRPDDADRAGASPWERMQDEAAAGVLFSFGAITCRLPADVYAVFEAGCPNSGIAEYVAGVLSAHRDS